MPLIGKTYTTLLLGLLLFVLVALSSPTEDLEDSSNIPGRYVIQFKPGLSDGELKSQIERNTDIHNENLNSNLTSGIRKIIRFSSFVAYSGEFSERTIKALRANENVIQVEPDSEVSFVAVITQKNANINLALLSTKDQYESIRKTHNYKYHEAAGSNQFVYVIDSGIETKHVEFEGRAFKGFSVRPKGDPADFTGHGTHCAGIIGSKTYGVAKKVTMIDVQVGNYYNEPTVSDVLDGLIWAKNDAIKHGRVGNSLASISIAMEDSPVLIDAIRDAYEEGFLTVVAAGNEGKEVPEGSMASSPNALTVGATDSNRKRLRYSNYGKHVNVFAPGENIRSAIPGTKLFSLPPGKKRTAELSGSSMAAAYVSGLVAYLRSVYGPSLEKPADVIAKIQELAVRNVPEAKGPNNFFVYNGVL